MTVGIAYVLKNKRADIIKIALSAVALIGCILVQAYLGGGLWWLYLVPYLICGTETLIKMISNIAHGDVFDENFLMSVATIGAFFVGEYPEAVMVMLLYRVGECFEDIAVNRSRESVQGLFRMTEDDICVEREGKIITIPQKELVIGDTVALRVGDTLPADAVIEEGESTFDCSHLTGESRPVSYGVGDTVYSGSINQSAFVRCKIQKSPADSMAAKILHITQEAAARKSKTEKFISRFARIYTPCVVACAVALAFLPPLFYESYTQALYIWGYRALIFLVVSCPCALVISVPLGFFAGIGAASKKGILIKSTGFIESLSRAKTAVFDKTGTLTEGKLSVVGVYGDRVDRDMLLNYAASIEKYSNHPAAHAICSIAGGNIPIKDAHEDAGHGMVGMIGDKVLLCGNIKLMRKHGINLTEQRELLGTVIYVSYGGEYLGHIELADTLKKNARKAVEALHDFGIEHTVMLTGDREAVAETVARELSIGSYRAELLPSDKLDEIEALCGDIKKDGTVIFVGDGINDTPSIARADIGVSMGAIASDAAIEQADVVLMDDDIYKLYVALSISKKTMRVVKTNIIFALSVKVSVLLFGALGYSGMGLAVFADVGVSALAILNSMSLLRYTPRILDK